MLDLLTQNIDADSSEIADARPSFAPLGALNMENHHDRFSV